MVTQPGLNAPVYRYPPPNSPFNAGVAGSPQSTGDSPALSLLRVVTEMLGIMCSILDSSQSPGISGLSGASGAAGAPALPSFGPGFGLAQSQTPPGLPAAQAPAASRPLRIAQIDSFGTTNGFNHGREVGQTILNGGVDPSLAGRIELVQFGENSGTGVSAGNVSNALVNIIQRVQRGERFDAVNISLQSFQNDPGTAQNRGLISQLVALGVPVVVAAGNRANLTNQLAPGNAFIVGSSINPNTARGNVSAPGRDSSFSTAMLTPLIAQYRSLGYSIPQIMSVL